MSLSKSRFVEMFERTKATLKLKDCCLKFCDGDWIESKDQSNTGIRLIQTGNIGNGVFRNKADKSRYISEETFNKLKCTEIFSGDVLVSRLPDPIGRACILPNIQKSITSVDCSILRFKEFIIPEYFINFTMSPLYKSQIESSSTGATRKRISRNNLGEVLIPIPTLDNQKKFAQYVHQIDKSKFLLQKILEKLELLKKSRFVELIGDPIINPYHWDKLTIKDVCSSIVRGPFGSALKKEFFVPDSDGVFKVYEQKNAIQKNKDIGSYFIDAGKFEELKRFECCSGDILMSCSGTVGELYQLPENCRRGVINQALCKFTLNNKILPNIFLSYMKETIGNISTQGSAIKNVASVAFIKSLPIIVPPINVQKQYIKELEQIDKSKLVIQKSLENLIGKS